MGWAQRRYWNKLGLWYSRVTGTAKPSRNDAEGPIQKLDGRAVVMISLSLHLVKPEKITEMTLRVVAILRYIFVLSLFHDVIISNATLSS